jgi:hypothetical protein
MQMMLNSNQKPAMIFINSRTSIQEVKINIFKIVNNLGL